MTAKILQISFKFNVPRSDYEAAGAPLAARIAAVPGCHWQAHLAVIHARLGRI